LHNVQYSSRVFCLLPRTTAIKRRVAERGGHGLTSFSTQTCGTPRFTTAIFHPSSWSWQPMKYPLLSHVVHRKSRWTLRFAKIAWTSVIYVLLLILSYIYILYFRFEEQTNKDVCILEIALATYVVISHIWMELGLERMFELSRVREP